MNNNLKYPLLPSPYSSAGFIGSDPRSIDQIIAEDTAVLTGLGISRQDFVLRLKNVYEKAKNSFGSPVSITAESAAVFYDSRGKIPSPFEGDGVFEKGEAVVTGVKSNQQIIITGLSIHLIEKYGFFQGKGTRYRIDPELAVRLLPAMIR
jgi:hypothetical protein